jgi:hypothetical protein
MMANKDEAFARKARLASERTGWGRELCGYVNNCWGAQFLGYRDDGSPFPLRDMCVPFPDPCDQHTMRGQQCMDLSPIPRWGADWPMYLGERDPKREEEMIEHRIYCVMKIINDIERIFGTKFDDDRLFEVYKTRGATRQYGYEITLAMTNKPTPISQKDLYSFYTLGGLTKLGPRRRRTSGRSCATRFCGVWTTRLRRWATSATAGWKPIPPPGIICAICVTWKSTAPSASAPSTARWPADRSS